MQYKAIVLFTDGQDNGYKYEAGDVYPREGYTPTPERIRELMTSANKRGLPLIAEAKPAVTEEKAEEKPAKKEAKKKSKKK